MDEAVEVVLSGGNASGTVVRIGDTVRKPWLPDTERVRTYLAALWDRGIDAPIHLGRDAKGRQVVEYVPGSLAMEQGPLQLVTVAAVGRLVRSIHDASADLPVPDDWPVVIPAETPDLLCHNDLAAWNLVVDGERLVFVDWDGAGPSTRLWDLAYASISFAHLFPGSDPVACAARLRAFVDGYDASTELRAILPVTLAERSRAMRDLLVRAHGTGEQPWASMYADGHGAHWSATTAFVHEHEGLWRAACEGSVR